MNLTHTFLRDVKKAASKKGQKSNEEFRFLISCSDSREIQRLNTSVTRLGRNGFLSTERAFSDHFVSIIGGRRSDQWWMC